jgi:APA family basic amino acid/polyamine antiporter
MVGTGVFTSLGYQLLNIESTFPLLFLWIIGGFLALCGALTYAELATIFPRSGGEYSLLSNIIHPSVGFCAGLISATIGFAAPSVLASFAFANYLSTIFDFTNVKLISIIIIFIFHIIHISSIKVGTSFQDISTFIKILSILIFILIGLNIENPQNLVIRPTSKDIDIIFSSFFATSLIWVSYAYTGWNSIIYIASEVKNPKINISKSMFFSTFSVMILYVLLNYIFLYTAPMTSLKGEVEVAHVSGKYIFGESGGKIISIGIALLLLSTVSSYVYIGPRVMEVMGRDYKILSFLKKTDSKKIPKNAFLLQFIVSSLFIFTSSFEQVLMYTGISLILTSSITVFALFISRIKNKNLKRPYRTWGYPITPIFYLSLNTWIIYNSFLESTFESAIGLGIFIFVTLFHYFYFSKTNYE